MNFLTFTETRSVGLVILPTSRENRPRRLGMGKVFGNSDQGRRIAKIDRLLRNYAVANRVKNQLRQPAKIQLLHQIRAVALDRVHTEIQQVRDLFV